jgi:hypothetical protein
VPLRQPNGGIIGPSAGVAVVSTSTDDHDRTTVSHSPTNHMKKRMSNPPSRPSDHRPHGGAERVLKGLFPHRLVL